MSEKRLNKQVPLFSVARALLSRCWVAATGILDLHALQVAPAVPLQVEEGQRQSPCHEQGLGPQDLLLLHLWFSAPRKEARDIFCHLASSCLSAYKTLHHTR